MVTFDTGSNTSSGMFIDTQQYPLPSLSWTVYMYMTATTLFKANLSKETPHRYINVPTAQQTNLHLSSE